MPNKLLTHDELATRIAAWVAAWNARAAYLRATQGVDDGEAQEQDRQDRGEEHA